MRSKNFGWFLFGIIYLIMLLFLAFKYDPNNLPHRSMKEIDIQNNERPQTETTDSCRAAQRIPELDNDGIFLHCWDIMTENKSGTKLYSNR